MASNCRSPCSNDHDSPDDKSVFPTPNLPNAIPEFSVETNTEPTLVFLRGLFAERGPTSAEEDPYLPPYENIRGLLWLVS